MQKEIAFAQGANEMKYVFANVSAGCRFHYAATVAFLIHHDVVRDLKFARIWGSGKFNSPQLGKDRVVAG